MYQYFSAPAIAPSIRRPVAAFGFLAAVGLALFVARYAGLAGPSSADQQVHLFLSGTFWSERNGLRQLIRLAGPTGVTVAAVLLGTISALLGRGRLALVCVAGPALTGVTTTVLQPVVGRTLDGGFALPSGHTAGVTSVAIVAGLLVVTVTPRARCAMAICAFCVVAVGTLMAVALIVNNLHYATDTIAGFCAATAVVLGTAFAVDGIKHNRRGARARPSVRTLARPATSQGGMTRPRMSSAGPDNDRA